MKTAKQELEELRATGRGGIARGSSAYHEVKVRGDLPPESPKTIDQRGPTEEERLVLVLADARRRRLVMIDNIEEGIDKVERYLRRLHELERKIQGLEDRL